MEKGDWKRRRLKGNDNKVWKYRGEGMVDKVCDKVRKGKGWIENYNEEIIVPMMKKGKGIRIEDYRKVMLILTLYNVYALVLVN